VVPKEKDRIKALHRYNVLDTPPDGTFDKITAMLAQLLNVPVAIVSLVDTDRIWFKSHHGIAAEEVDREPGLCASAILEDIPYILNDASRDLRSLSNPLVAGELGLRFYAGVPLQTHDNYNLGVLCAIDFEPRNISDEELNILKTLAGIVMDEMELRLSARKIEDMRNEKDLIIQSAGDGICALDANRIVTEWNIAAERMTGLSRNEILYQDIHTYIKSIDDSGEDCPICTCIKQGIVTQANDVELPRYDGTTFPAEVMCTPILQNNHVMGTVVVFKDISEKKRTVEYLHRLDKLKLAGQLAASVAHELRNPLTTIKGFAHMLSQQNSELPYYKVVEEEVNRIQKIIDEFLVLANQQAPVWTRTDIRLILQNVKVLLNTEAVSRSIRIDIVADDETPMVYGERERLKQVFVNIIKNAMESMKSGGTVTVECTTTHQGDVLVRVIDTGCGISEERVSRLGEPFYSTKEKGTGLGLMVSCSIIEQHKGQISIENPVNQGTTVNIRLPSENWAE